MINKKNIAAMIALAVVVISCKTKDVIKIDKNPTQGKIVVYQVFTRLFGNKNLADW